MNNNVSSQKWNVMKSLYLDYLFDKLEFVNSKFQKADKS